MGRFLLTGYLEKQARSTLIRSSIGPAELQQIAAGFIPVEFPRIKWKDVWERPLRAGIGFEWTIFAALVWALRERAWKVSFPHLGNAALQEFFVRHNEFPLHYIGKVGHSSVGAKPGLLIMAALTPKAVAFKNGKWISIFREGCSYHRIYSDEPYEERPDIVMAAGTPAPGFPNYQEQKNLVAYRYILNGSQVLEGILRAINSPTPSVVQRIPSKGYHFRALGVIECSVNKLKQRALQQLQVYGSRFFEQWESQLILISCQPIAIPSRCYFVELSADTRTFRKNLAGTLIQIVESVCQTLG